MSTQDHDEDLAASRRVRDAISMLGLTQTEVVNRIGIHRTYLSDVCRGVKTPGAKLLRGLTQHYNISASWLLCGAGPMLWSAIHHIGPEPVEHKAAQLLEAAARLAREPTADTELEAQLRRILKGGDIGLRRQIQGYLDGIEASLSTQTPARTG